MNDKRMGRLERIASGDRQALAEEYELSRPRLKRMVELRLDRRVQGRVDPSDILQEVFFEIAERAVEYAKHPSMPFFLWLRLVTKQKLLEFHRRHLTTQKRDARREIQILDIGPAPSTDCLALQLAGDYTSVTQAVERSELQEIMRKVLDRLSDMDREILALRHFEELSNDEIADVLCISKTAASNRYVRALVRLEEQLREIPGFIDMERFRD